MLVAHLFFPPTAHIWLFLYLCKPIGINLAFSMATYAVAAGYSMWVTHDGNSITTDMEEYRIIALYAVATSTALKAIGWVWGKRKYDEDGQYDETGKLSFSAVSPTHLARLRAHGLGRCSGGSCCASWSGC